MLDHQSINPYAATVNASSSDVETGPALGGISLHFDTRSVANQAWSQPLESVIRRRLGEPISPCSKFALRRRC